MKNDYYTDAKNKAQILHYGINFTNQALKEFKNGYLIKRRFYSNYDDKKYTKVDVPQEIVFPKSGIVATAILRSDSPLVIDYNGNGFVLCDKITHREIDINVAKKPSFYGMMLSNNEFVEKYITKLFGHTIGVFVSTSCIFAFGNEICKFCSIRANKARPKDINETINIDRTIEAIKLAIINDDAIDDIFISGGVAFDDYNANFIFYSDIALRVKDVLNSIGKKINVTLNTYPPRDLSLLDMLSGSEIAIMISLESFLDRTRAFLCPGKSRLYSDIGVDTILNKCVSVAGYGRVLAFAIQGFESAKTILRGVDYYASLGVCTVVHILHIDPGTWVHKQKMKPPMPEEIMDMAVEVSKIYCRNDLDTSQLYGGRSSLDLESSTGFLI